MSLSTWTKIYSIKSSIEIPSEFYESELLVRLCELGCFDVYSMKGKDCFITQIVLNAVPLQGLLFTHTNDDIIKRVSTSTTIKFSKIMENVSKEQKIKILYMIDILQAIGVNDD